MNQKEVTGIRMNSTDNLMVETFNDFSKRNKTGESKFFLLEYYNELKMLGVNIPEGFIIHPFCFDHFCAENGLEKKLHEVLSELRPDLSNLKEVSLSARTLIFTSSLPKNLYDAIQLAGRALQEQFSLSAKMILKSYKNYESVANYDIFMSIHNEEELIDACLQGFASLFTENAIRERAVYGLDGLFGSLYMIVQRMIRSDIASSGIISTFDEMNDNSLMLYGCWGMSQSVAAEMSACDEYQVSRPLLKSARNAVYDKRTGTKEKTLVYFNTSDGEKANLFYIDTPSSKKDKFVINDKEVIQLAKWALLIQELYGHPLQIEWAKDGLTNELYIVHAPASKKLTEKSST
jgi:pyruvate,water dikinase